MRAGWTLIVALGALLAGCEPANDPQPKRARPTTVQQPSAWQQIDGATLLAVSETDEAALVEAVARARRTAGRARADWQQTPASRRDEWSIKWAAPLEEAGAEHVWVIPLTWTEHRIEGRLANTPYRPLLCGRDKGEIVSFPVDQLADWMRVVDGVREGGFTVVALEERFGASP